MSETPLAEPYARACWCGDRRQFAYSGDYNVCRVCGTLISRHTAEPGEFAVRRDSGELYSKDYWLKRQAEKYGLPSIQERARLDLPERCAYWLRHLLPLRPPGARVLEVGCAHGGYVALLGWAGYQAMGTEMSPWVAEYARETFGADVRAGTVESLDLAPDSFDVVVLNDVIEHFPDPAGTLGRCARLLATGGFFVVQTPEYKEHLSHSDLVRTGDRFLKHMKGKSGEHLYLFSRRSAGLLFGRLGFPAIECATPIFDYDLFFTASRVPLTHRDPAEVEAALASRPVGRLVQALLDKAAESDDRQWAIRRLETGNRDSK